MDSKRPAPLPIHNDILEKDITVIIPVYNVEPYIEQCALTVLSQKGDFSWEIIFIDDGSTDKSMEVLQKVLENWNQKNDSANKPDIVCFSQENKGVGNARNRGLYAAKGEYIAFVDADDCLGSPYYLSDLWNAAVADDADICQEGLLQEKNGVRTSLGWSPKWDYSDRYYTFCKLPGYCTAKLIRKSLFDGLWFPEGCYYEDTIMQLVIFPRCKRYCQLDKEDYIYRTNPGSITFRKNKGNRGVDAVIAVDECLKMIRQTKLKVGVFWYGVFITHFQQLLFTRICHCDYGAARNAFLLACCLQDDAAEISHVIEFRPFDGADFFMEHRWFILWGIRCLFQKAGIIGIQGSKKKKVVKCRQYH